MYKVKVTKRQRKAARNNAAVEYSIKNGSEISVGNATYRGKAPVYELVKDLKTGVETWKKCCLGIPFVRVTKKTAYGR